MTDSRLVSLLNHRPCDKLSDRGKSAGSGVLRHGRPSFRRCSGEIELRRHGTMGGGVCMSWGMADHVGHDGNRPGMT